MRRLFHVLNNVFHQGTMSLDSIHSLLDVLEITQMVILQCKLFSKTTNFPLTVSPSKEMGICRRPRKNLWPGRESNP